MMTMDWIKVSTDMFRDEKILLLGNDARGDEMTAIWLRLLLLAGKMENDGVFLLKPGTPYTISQLATIMGKPTAKVKSAIGVFESLGMVAIESGVVTIPNWCKHQGTSEARERYQRANRDRQTRFREKQKCVINGVSNGVSNGNITHTDKDLDKDKDLEKKKYKKNNVTKRSPNEGYQHHDYTDDDFGDEFYFNTDVNRNKREFDLQAAAEEKKGQENHEGEDT